MDKRQARACPERASCPKCARDVDLVLGALRIHYVGTGKRRSEYGTRRRRCPGSGLQIHYADGESCAGSMRLPVGTEDGARRELAAKAVATSLVDGNPAPPSMVDLDAALFALEVEVRRQADYHRARIHFEEELDRHDFPRALLEDPGILRLIRQASDLGQWLAFHAAGTKVEEALSARDALEAGGDA